MNKLFDFFKNKKWLVTAFVVIAILVTVGFYSTSTGSAEQVETVKVVSLNLAETVDATGMLEAQPFAGLNWKAGGVVETVYVKPGDFVKAGDTLLILQPESASSALVSAQADLEAAQASLRALTSPDGSSIGLARENASSAFEAWDNAREDLMDQISYNKFGGDDALYEDVVAARDDLSGALDDYPLAANSTAQFYYWAARADALGYRGDFDFAALKISLRAKLGEGDAKLVDEILRTQTEFDRLAKAFAESMEDQEDAVKVMMALGAYEQSSDALLDALQANYGVAVAPSKSDLSSAQAKVDAAQASVNSLSIIAPFDGQVLSVEHRAGDVVNAGELSVNIADLNHLYVEAQVDESDVAKVRVGNQVAVTLDALPGVELPGAVEAINPVGEISSGLIKFSVLIALKPVDQEVIIPLGATADSVIQIREAAKVLAVPLAAVLNDDQGEYVLVMQGDGTTQRVAVESSTIQGDLVVITGNLKAGDKLQVVHTSGFKAPNPFGGNK